MYVYFFAVWLNCWLDRTWYTWPLSLLTMWCRFDLYSALLSWVLGHEHLQPTFHLHKEEQQAVNHFFYGKKVYLVLKCIKGCHCITGTVLCHSRAFTDILRGSRMNAVIRHEEGAGPTTEGNSERVSSLSSHNFYVGHLESKERLCIQPAQLFNFSW